MKKGGERGDLKNAKSKKIEKMEPPEKGGKQGGKEGVKMGAKINVKKLSQSKLDEIWPRGVARGEYKMRKNANFNKEDPPGKGGRGKGKEEDEMGRGRCLATTPKRKRGIEDLGGRGDYKNQKLSKNF